MEHISFLDPRARTTRDGHAAKDLRKAVEEIASRIGQPTEVTRDQMGPLAAILVESMAQGNDNDIMNHVRLITRQVMAG